MLNIELKFNPNNFVIIIDAESLTRAEHRVISRYNRYLDLIKADTDKHIFYMLHKRYYYRLIREPYDSQKHGTKEQIQRHATADLERAVARRWDEW